MRYARNIMSLLNTWKRIDVAATAGNVPDSQPYIKRIDYIEKNLGLKIQEACADSGYDTNLIHQQ